MIRVFNYLRENTPALSSCLDGQTGLLQHVTRLLLALVQCTLDLGEDRKESMMDGNSVHFH